MAAGAEVVERIEAIVDTRDRDPSFAVVRVVWNYEVVSTDPSVRKASASSSVTGFSF